MLTFLDALKRLLVGRPFRSERLKQQSLPKREAFGLFSASALSSVAYSPDEILLTLALAGTAALALSPWVGLAVIMDRRAGRQGRRQVAQIVLQAARAGLGIPAAAAAAAAGPAAVGSDRGGHRVSPSGLSTARGPRDLSPRGPGARGPG